MKTPVANTAKAAWQDALPRHPDIFLDQFDVFRNYLVLNERKAGLRQLRVVDLEDQKRPVLEVRRVGLHRHHWCECRAGHARAALQLHLAGYAAFHLCLRHGQHTTTLLKEQPVLGGFDKRDYVTERTFVKARDGKQIPMSIVYKKGTKLDGTHRCFIMPMAATVIAGPKFQRRPPEPARPWFCLRHVQYPGRAGDGPPMV